jgi:dolichol kinase
VVEVGTAEVPIVRDANAARSLFHILSGVGTVLLIELVLSERGMMVVAVSVASWAWSMELGRRVIPGLNRLLMWIFTHVAHPHERRYVNSSTWYITSLVVLAFTADKLAASLGVIILALGDPAAAFIGRAFGRTRLVGSRTLEGSLAFLAAGFVASFTVIGLFHPEVALMRAAAIAIIATAAGALAELGARSLDDNFLVPVAACAAVLVVSYA